jgi:undecaprenyl-diphosphatase
LDLLALAVTKFLVPLLVILVAGQWWLRGDRARLRHDIVASGLAFCLGLAINQLILLLVERARPYLAGVTHLIVEPSTDPSFPSDHATASVAIAAAFLLNGDRIRGSVFAAAALLVSLSRVYVGTHYFGDVLGGAVTGVLAAFVVSVGYRRGSRVDLLVVRLL